MTTKKKVTQAEKELKAINNERLFNIVKTKLNRDPDVINQKINEWYNSYEWLNNISEEEAPKAKKFLIEAVLEMIEEGKL